jgi:hypothetical protein
MNHIIFRFVPFPQRGDRQKKRGEERRREQDVEMRKKGCETQGKEDAESNPTRTEQDQPVSSVFFAEGRLHSLRLLQRNEMGGK